MNILFYEPYNHSVNYIESIAERFIHDGDTVFFISHDAWGPIHDKVEQMGGTILTFESTATIRPLYYYRRIAELARHCKKHDIQVVYSHYQEANIIAVLAQYFTKIPWIPTRHHSDCAYVDENKKEMIADKVINRLSRVCISPSKKVTDQMVAVEGMKPGKVREINYGYNFSMLRAPQIASVEKIRAEYPTSLRMVKAARFIPEKRHLDLLRCLAPLAHAGTDMHLLLLGDGPEKARIEQEIAKLDLANHVTICGFKSNVQDYYAAADIVVHFSISEASNSAIKEAAMCGTSAIVCDNVGDFGDYFIHGENGFLLNRENPAAELPALVSSIAEGEYDLIELGRKLKETVSERFDVGSVIQNYYQLHTELLK